MREYRLRDLEATREKERARTLRRLGPLPDPRPCAECGTGFVPGLRRDSTAFCSRKCRDRARRQAAQARINEAKPDRLCAWCDKPMPRTMRADARFCSEDCNTYAHVTTRKYRRRRGETEKRKGTPLVSIGTLAAVNGWKCPLCGKRINRNLRHPDPAAPSIDHLVPLSRGGTNDEANLQVVHLRCNLAKRDRPQGEQLRIV